MSDTEVAGRSGLAASVLSRKCSDAWKPVDLEALGAAIDALFECAQVCSLCAGACLMESDLDELVQCVVLDLACADACLAAGRAAAYGLGPGDPALQAVLQSCVSVCRRCSEECARHADHHDHCRKCAAACARCEQACVRLLDQLADVEPRWRPSAAQTDVD
jgi:hypothetical protein